MNLSIGEEIHVQTIRKGFLNRGTVTHIDTFKDGWGHEMSYAVTDRINPNTGDFFRFNCLKFEE